MYTQMMARLTTMVLALALVVSAAGCRQQQPSADGAAGSANTVTVAQRTFSSHVTAIGAVKAQVGQPA